MRRVILESPYAKPTPETPEHPTFPGGSYQFVAYARRATADALRRGEAPLVSHLLYTQAGILRDDLPEERRLGIDAGTEWLRGAEAVVVYADYGITPGMRIRIETAETRDIPVEIREIGK